MSAALTQRLDPGWFDGRRPQGGRAAGSRGLRVGRGSARFGHGSCGLFILRYIKKEPSQVISITRQAENILNSHFLFNSETLFKPITMVFFFSVPFKNSEYRALLGERIKMKWASLLRVTHQADLFGFG